MIRSALALTAIFAASALITPEGVAPERLEGSRRRQDSEESRRRHRRRKEGDRHELRACHGASGRGDGVASVALQPKPTDWSSPAVQSDTDGELFWKITNGRGAMPAWKQLPEAERWQIVNYIRTLKK
jgi:hypothetical protein